MFTLDFIRTHVSQLYKLLYSDFYDREERIIPAAAAVANTGIDFTLWQIQTFREPVYSMQNEIHQKACRTANIY
jgi:hypothetical protein